MTRTRVGVPAAVASGVVVIAACVPLFYGSDFNLLRFNFTLILILAAVGLNFAFGYGGQVALGQPVLLATGAYTAAILSSRYGWGIGATIVPGIVATALASLLLGAPSLRVNGWYLAIISFFAILVLPDFLQAISSVTGGTDGLIDIPPVEFFGHVLGNAAVYEVLLGVLIVCLLATRNLMRSSWGTIVHTLRDHPLAAESCGVRLIWTKALVYLISGLPCGVAGVLYAHNSQYVAPSIFSFNQLLVLIGGVFIGGAGTLFGAVLGVAIFEAISLWIGPFSTYNNLFVGAGVVVVAVAFRGGIVPRLVALSGAVRARLPRGANRAAAAPSADESPDEAPAPSGPTVRVLAPIDPHDGLVVTGVSKSFKGNRVLTDVDLHIPGGELVGLVGSNGSGKTTLLNVITGFVSADAGSVSVDGQVVTGSSPASIARRGVGRTFQSPRLVGRLSVARNIDLGLIGRERQAALGSVLRLPRFRRAERERRRVIEELWTDMGLDAQLLDRPVAQLSLGLQRIVEVVRAAIAGPPLICLDEPTAGLDSHERDMLAAVLVAIVAQGRSVLLIEHNLRFVLDACDEVVLLEGGQIVGRGRPRDSALDQALREYVDTYLVDPRRRTV